jgi:quinol monooxygenase YgiN
LSGACSDAVPGDVPAPLNPGAAVKCGDAAPGFRHCVDGRPTQLPRISVGYLEESHMRKSVLLSVAALALAAAFVSLPSSNAAAQSSEVYINAVELVIIPSEMPKFLEAIKENAANAVKEPGCREFNVSVLANRPNHVFLYEVYDNEAALNTHRQTEHFKKFAATTASMVADRNIRAMTPIAFNAKGH